MERSLVRRAVLRWGVGASLRWTGAALWRRVSPGAGQGWISCFGAARHAALLVAKMGRGAAHTALKDTTGKCVEKKTNGYVPL